MKILIAFETQRLNRVCTENSDVPMDAIVTEEIRKELNFTSLHYHRLDDMLDAIGLDSDQLCTYCWSGKE